ncbi:thrombospondin type 3 repeat-containing protein [Akkermansiaceae bacterium]|nr:thrombospondin type 3 repeat-containing protein [Akkermansiaceae bacterium]
MRRRAFVLCGIALSTGLASADPVITDVSITTTQVIVSFEEDGPNNQFEIERNPNLLATNWSSDNSATLTPQGGGVFTYTLSRNAADKEFFRVIGSFLGTGLDPDGDGLPTTLEDTFTANTSSPDYSDPNDFDTDNDGFSDGVEYAYGTEPNNTASKPDQASLPQVQFTNSVSSAMEGEATHSIPITISSSYSGTIYYAINSGTTATTPDDFGTISGTTTASGGTATIDLAITDNLAISQYERLILIDLSKNPLGNGYRPAGRVTHIVCLTDNDSYWNGVLVDELTERNFRLRVRRDASTTEVAFVSGDSDGLLTPDAGASSQSTGIIPETNLAGNPQEVFLSSTPSFSDVFVSASTPDLPATTSGFLGTTPLKRTLVIAANPGMNPDHNITPTAILGKFTEIISHATDPDATYLDTTIEGSMVLTKDVPLPANLESPFVAAP